MEEIIKLCKKLPKVKCFRINNGIITYEIGYTLNQIDLKNLSKKEFDKYSNLLLLKAFNIGFVKNKDRPNYINSKYNND